MKNLKDAKAKIFPSKMRGGKELPSSSALDSPSVISKLATPSHAINPDISQVVDDATVLQDAANATLRSETLRETVCDTIIANGGV